MSEPSAPSIPLTDIPSVQDIDHWHNTGSLGDLYIQCQGLREEVLRLKEERLSLVHRADVQYLRDLAVRALFPPKEKNPASASSHKDYLRAIISHADRALGLDTGKRMA